MPRPLYLLIASLVVYNIFAIRLYKSKLRNNPTSMKLVKSSVTKETNFENGISICGRFMFDRVQRPQHIFSAQKVLWPEHPTKVWFLSIFNNGKRGAFLEFGSFFSLLEVPTKDRFKLWTQSVWHSICISFDRNTNHLSIVKDGISTNIDLKLNQAKLEGLDNTLLNEFYPMDWPNSGQVSDINIWDFSLHCNFMKNWTMCRYVNIVFLN